MSFALAVALTGAAVKGTTSTDAIQSWIFEPFNSRLGSSDYLPVHPFLGGGIHDGAGRDGIVSYVVNPGDTVSVVAYQFGLSTETLVWANDIADVNLIVPGDVLKIPPVSGVLHTVVAGDKLPSLAEKYDVLLDKVLAYPLNKIENPDELITGQLIMFPGGIKPRPPRPVLNATSRPGSGGDAPPPAPAAITRGGRFGWPSGGAISQYYSAGHPAIDIAASFGSPLYAVESGVVVLAGSGWNGGYGTVVDIDHGNGYVSRYSHLANLYVERGDVVRRGQLIGTIGVTGITTGPHVHFEIIVNGRRLNPLQFLS